MLVGVFQVLVAKMRGHRCTCVGQKPKPRAASTSRSALIPAGPGWVAAQRRVFTSRLFSSSAGSSSIPGFYGATSEQSQQETLKDPSSHVSVLLPARAQPAEHGKLREPWEGALLSQTPRTFLKSRYYGGKGESMLGTADVL